MKKKYGQKQLVWKYDDCDNYEWDFRPKMHLLNGIFSVWETLILDYS